MAFSPFYVPHTPLAQSVYDRLSRDIKEAGRVTVSTATQKLDIRAMSETDRKKLRTATTGSELLGLFVNDDVTDSFPVKFYVKNALGSYLSRAIRNDGTLDGVPYVKLPAEPINIGPGPHLNHLVHDGVQQAVIEIVNTEVIAKGVGLNGKTPPKFKLVPVE